MVYDPVVSSIWLVALYPLIAFAIIALGRWAGIIRVKAISPLLVVGATALGLIHSIAALVLWEGADYQPLQQDWVWLHAGSLQLVFGYLLDSTSMLMLLVVTSVSMLIQIYTHGYMEKDPGYHRFYAYLALFNFSMLGLVLSTNLFQIYVFWEMVGVSSYLLIGFWLNRPSAAAAATKAFLMNRIGDLGLLIGILSFLYFSWDFWMQSSVPLLSFAHLGGAAQYTLQMAGPTTFAIICILIFMGPVAKSAQMPLHTWLPDAMEGPTPISALIHAATMVAAGVYLIARMYPMFTLSPEAMTIIAFVGGITAFAAATIALTQVDIKKALAYSTMSQLGYMVMAMGIGAYTAGLFHLMTHAFFKAMLFLCSGSVIHGCHEEQDMRNMGGLWKYMPITAATYLVGTIAITGILPFAGFWSKDEIIASSFEAQPILFAIALVTAGMTSFYMFRTYFLTFHGTYRGTAHPHESPVSMTLPLVVLAIPSVVIGFALSGLLGTPSFGHFIHYPVDMHPLANESMNLGVMAASVLVAFGGFLLSFIMYGGIRLLSPSVIVDKFRPVYTFFWNKWYFDDLYGAIAKKVYLPIAGLSAWFDRTVIDGIVNLTAGTVSGTSGVMRLVQSGRVQTYLTLLVFGFLLLFVVLNWMI